MDSLDSNKNVCLKFEVLMNRWIQFLEQLRVASYLIVEAQILAVTSLFLSFAVVSTDGSRLVTNEIRESNEINMHESEELPLRNY